MYILCVYMYISQFSMLGLILYIFILSNCYRSSLRWEKWRLVIQTWKLSGGSFFIHFLCQVYFRFHTMTMTSSSCVPAMNNQMCCIYLGSLRLNLRYNDPKHLNVMTNRGDEILLISGSGSAPIDQKWFLGNTATHKNAFNVIMSRMR